MLKIKNLKIAAKHLVTALSALGMLVGFFLALGGKRKTAPLIVFLTSFAGLAAGLGMETGLLPEPECLKSLEVEIDPEDEDGEENGEEEEDGDFDPQVIFDEIGKKISQAAEDAEKEAGTEEGKEEE